MGNKLHNCVLSTQKVRFSEVDSGNRERHWHIAAFLYQMDTVQGDPGDPPSSTIHLVPLTAGRPGILI